ncbi:MAG TPA: hypothetical protein VI197_03035 [Polyangiaceae bacterium]
MICVRAAGVRPSHALTALALLLGACDSGSSAGSSAAPAGSASAGASAAPSASSVPVAKLAGGVPIAPSVVEGVVNPKREPAYAGPVGSVAGSVSIVGDPSPVDRVRTSIPADCLAARETYKHAFREGIMRSAADVFVAVTGYEGYLPAREDVMTLNASGCAFDTRTVGLTFGQALDIASKDRRAYVPELLGSRATAQLVVTPGGDPVRLYPQSPGRYVLVDSMRTFATADVLVVAYRTFDVTGLDGKFEIKDVPVGKVTLSALLPEAMLTTEREITVEAGQTTSVDLELRFDQKRYEEQLAKAKKSTAAPKASD